MSTSLYNSLLFYRGRYMTECAIGKTEKQARRYFKSWGFIVPASSAAFRRFLKSGSLAVRSERIVRI